jgi:hypothetical protein
LNEDLEIHFLEKKKVADVGSGTNATLIASRWK